MASPTAEQRFVLSGLLMIGVAMVPAGIASIVAALSQCSDVEVAVPARPVAIRVPVQDVKTLSMKECELSSDVVTESADLEGRVALASLPADKPVKDAQLGSKPLSATDDRSAAAGTSVALPKGNMLVVAEAFTAGDEVELLFSPIKRAPHRTPPSAFATVLANTDTTLVVMIDDVTAFNRFAGSSLVIVRRAGP